MKRLARLLATALLAFPPPSAFAQAPRADERALMVATIEAYARSVPALPDGRIESDVLEVMRTLPRHEFIPEDRRRYAYADRPVPIGYGQTISQPFIVALMTDLADVDRDERVLEIGTGSGYQAAVLSPLAGRVHTIEIIPELGERARATLERLGFDNVETRIGDGYYGWPEAAPFGAIVVTAAASHVPPPLIEQLAPGGRMIIPVGGPFATQQLMLVEKRPDGSVTNRQILPVRFVPLRRAPPE